MALLSPAQEDALTNFDTMYTKYQQAKVTLEGRLRAQVDAELDMLRLEANVAGHDAIYAGVPVSRLGDKSRAGLRTNNYNTIRKFLGIEVPSREAA